MWNHLVLNVDIRRVSRSDALWDKDWFNKMERVGMRQKWEEQKPLCLVFRSKVERKTQEMERTNTFVAFLSSQVCFSYQIILLFDFTLLLVFPCKIIEHTQSQIIIKEKEKDDNETLERVLHTTNLQRYKDFELIAMGKNKIHVVLW